MPKRPDFEIKKSEGRKKPFFFDIPASCSTSGKRERKFFETLSQAKSARQLELVRVQNFGSSQSTLPSDVRRDAVRAQKLLEPYGLSLLEAVKQFIEAKKILNAIDCPVPVAARCHLENEIGRAKSCTFGELMEQFVAAKVQERLSKPYLKQIELTKKEFLPAMKDRMACEVSTKELSQALTRFGEKPASFSAHLRVLKAAFNFGIDHDYLSRNPANKIKPPKQKPREVKILSNSQVRAILEVTREKDLEMLPYFAVGVFAGLRPTELMALEWRDINFEKKEVFVRHRGANSKERVGRSVPIEPVLEKWLQLSSQTSGHVTPSYNHRNRFEAIRRHADSWLVGRGFHAEANLGEHWDNDCMRHTTASNWDGFTGNMAQTALWLGHTEQVHRKHYYHPVPKLDAEEFWQITPSEKDASSEDDSAQEC